MLVFRKSSWGDDANPPGKYSTLAFSQANSFHMSPAPQKRLAVALAAFGEGHINLMRIASSGHEIDVTDEGSLTVMLPSRGAIEVTVDGKRYQASADGVLCFGPSHRRTHVSSTNAAEFESYLLKLPVAVPGLTGLRSEHASFDTRDPFIPTATDTAPALRDLIGYVFSDLESPTPLLRSQKASTLAEALVHEHFRSLVETVFEPDESAGPVPLKNVRQAEEFMRAHFAMPLRVADIAAAAGLRVRSLETAFQRVAGSTPWAKLTSIRLEQAQLRLLTSDGTESVTSIALECGFAHLGRFARLYKKALGELPSETLRRRRS